MGYKKACDVLPEELVAMIQNYFDGDYLYIPRKRGNELSWGEKNGTRIAMEARDRRIYRSYMDGLSKEQLSEEYHLSIKSIKSIKRVIYKQKD
ncbi:hypothetical protein FZC79_22495 [Rossellomorea vietnamensis]|uniref:Mor transcription activator domain-containing protein n=1 Tax=Rossellomorea vietnamensis TaxID=218284 RepID=A0A5D4K8X8_9BACI|nr:CD3324 family protein [Rossellomorea vietnamensis]TYR72513.1 hypothetical protein FZC79_22495 [Rossellomorea vietnamensis]